MAQQEKNIINQQLVRSYISSVVSISLVLLLMGMVGLLALNARGVSNFFKEKLGVTVLLQPSVKDADSTLLLKQIQMVPYSKKAVLQTQYISREQGTREMADLLGADFLDVFLDNPLPASVELKLGADYVQRDSIALLEQDLLRLSFVQEISYQAPLVDLINKNLNKLSLAIGAFTLLLFLISLSLIHNTIRLSVFARRFTIHTMSLVGATRGFIRRPFMEQAVLQGLISALLSCLLLMGGLFLLQRQVPGVLMLLHPESFAMLVGGILFLGIFICGISTYFVVNKVVRLDDSALYY